MEKNGSISITEQEITSFLETGQVSQRLTSDWGLSPEDMKSLLQNKNYNLIKVTNNNVS